MKDKLFIFICCAIIFISCITCIIISMNNNNSKKYNNFKAADVTPVPTTKVTIFNTIKSNSPLQISFPEQCPENSLTYNFPIPDINKVSLAISGGGSRAFISDIGYFRALTRLGLHDKAQYVSSVSGSSWFYGLYSYCEENTNYKNTDLLGISCGLVSNPINNNYIDPSLITNSNLSTTNNTDYFFGKRMINDTLITNMTSALVYSNITMDNVWSYAIGKLVLEYYKLNDDVPISISSTHANILETNNIGKNALKLPKKWPFWLCNTVLFFNYIEQYPYSNVSVNPLYGGIPYQITLNNNTIGGLVYDNALFGNIDPPSNTKLLNSYPTCTNTYVQYSSGNKIRTLRDMIGASSTFYASLVYNAKNINPVLGLFMPSNSPDLIPSYTIWGNRFPIGTLKDSQCSTNLLKTQCTVPYGYDKNSCVFDSSSASCYSKSQAQCVSNTDCVFKTDVLSGKIGCYNKDPNKSSLYCKNAINIFKPTACKCDKNSPYIENTSTILNSQNVRLADGGLSDNIGVISLLSRGVKHIIGFAHTPATTVTDFNDISKCLSDVAVLFGFSGDKSCQETLLGIKTSQVFNKSDYQPFVNQFITTYQTGGPCYARATLDVLTNTVNGVAGNYKVDLLIILLQPAKNFINLLPLDIQNSIKDSSGDLRNFPNYATAFQNPTIGPISLTLKQINITTTYTEWSLYQEPLCSIIKEMFSY